MKKTDKIVYLLSALSVIFAMLGALFNVLHVTWAYYVLLFLTILTIVGIMIVYVRLVLTSTEIVDHFFFNVLLLLLIIVDSAYILRYTGILSSAIRLCLLVSSIVLVIGCLGYSCIQYKKIGKKELTLYPFTCSQHNDFLISQGIVNVALLTIML